MAAVALEHIQEVLTPEQLGQAVELLAKARQVYVVAQRRSFPVAAYLAYALPHSEKPTHLLDGLGGMLDEQVRSIQPAWMDRIASSTAATFSLLCRDTSATPDDLSLADASANAALAAGVATPQPVVSRTASRPGFDGAGQVGGPYRPG